MPLLEGFWVFVLPLEIVARCAVIEIIQIHFRAFVLDHFIHSTSRRLRVKSTLRADVALKVNIQECALALSYKSHGL